MTVDTKATLQKFRDSGLRQSAAMDQLVARAVFGSPDERDLARWMIWEIGQAAGVRPASIHHLYMARGRGEVPPFTAPAMNVRVMAYDTGRFSGRPSASTPARCSARSRAARSRTPTSDPPNTSR